MYVPTRGSDSGSDVNHSSVSNNVINTDNKDRKTDPPSINNNNVNTANVIMVNTSINNNSGGIDKSNINKPRGTLGKTNTAGINANRAKFEEDLKKEPILQTILDVFDGELLS